MLFVVCSLLFVRHRPSVRRSVGRSVGRFEDSDATRDLSDTMVDLPDTMVDLPDTLDLS